MNLNEEAKLPVPKKLNKALLKAMAEVKPPPRDGQHIHYSYTKAETMIEHCRDALIANDILVARAEIIESNNWLTLYYVVYHDDEQKLYRRTMPYVPGKEPEKAIMKAATSDAAYFLRDLLWVPRVDEEVDTPSDNELTHELQTLKKELHATKAELNRIKGAKAESQVTKQLTMSDQYRDWVSKAVVPIAQWFGHPPSWLEAIVNVDKTETNSSVFEGAITRPAYRFLQAVSQREDGRSQLASILKNDPQLKLLRIGDGEHFKKMLDGMKHEVVV